MTLKIETTSAEGNTTIRLIGRIGVEHLDSLRAQIAGAKEKVALDLDEVTLVDADVVRFLWLCEQDGIQVVRCSPYIRDWMAREQRRAGQSQ